MKNPVSANIRPGLPRIFCLPTIVLLIFLLIWSVAITSAADKVKLQLRWDHQFQFAGYYAGKWQGFYQETRLDVEIKFPLTKKHSRMSAIL